MNIGLIGTSLITSLFAARLSEWADCFIFDKGHVGGAWSEKPIDSLSIPVTNNIICPLQEEEEACLVEIQRELDSHFKSTTLRTSGASINAMHSPGGYITGRFSPIIERIVLGDRICRTKEHVADAQINETDCTINGRKLDAIVLPSNFRIDNLAIRGTPVDLAYTRVRSEHLRAVSCVDINGPIYKENFDNIFDRGGVYQGRVFVGRVRREHKSRNPTDLIKESDFLSLYGDSIKRVEVNYYNNDRIGEESLSSLRLHLAGTAGVLLETRQFCKAWMGLDEMHRQINQIERRIKTARQC